jgi:ribonucleoside-diphosphate reductase alpha chain
VDIQDLIAQHGIRNSHLLSIAPTGTISLTADNVSSGIEPVFALTAERTVQTMDGPKKEVLKDYAYEVFGVKGRTANEVSVQEHLDVLLLASKYVDSAVSKTCNVGDHVTFNEFKDIYLKAWEGGAKGITTFRAAGKRFGILNVVNEGDESRAEACYIDPTTGTKTCE